MEVFRYLCPTLTGCINHGPYMSELNPVLVPAVAAIQSLHWEFFFFPQIPFTRDGRATCQFAYPFSSQLSPPLRDEEQIKNKALKIKFD